MRFPATEKCGPPWCANKKVEDNSDSITQYYVYFKITSGFNNLSWKVKDEVFNLPFNRQCHNRTGRLVHVATGSTWELSVVMPNLSATLSLRPLTVQHYCQRSGPCDKDILVCSNVKVGILGPVQQSTIVVSLDESRGYLGFSSHTAATAAEISF